MALKPTSRSSAGASSCADELAQALDLGEQRLDLGARGGILDRRIERQPDRVELRERLLEALSDRSGRAGRSSVSAWSAVLKPPGPA